MIVLRKPTKIYSLLILVILSLVLFASCGPKKDQPIGEGGEKGSGATAASPAEPGEGKYGSMEELRANLKDLLKNEKALADYLDNKSLNEDEKAFWSQINGPTLLTPGSVMDWASLMNRLKEAEANKDRGVIRIREFMGDDAKKIVDTWNKDQELTDEDKGKVIDGINMGLKNKSFFDKNVFSNPNSWPDGKVYMKKGIDKLNTEEMLKFNRILSDTVFSREIKPMPPEGSISPEQWVKYYRMVKLGLLDDNIKSGEVWGAGMETLDLMRLKPGETVGVVKCGYGSDLFLIADRVGKNGLVYALDNDTNAKVLLDCRRERRQELYGKKYDNIIFVNNLIDNLTLRENSVDTLLMRHIHLFFWKMAEGSPGDKLMKGFGKSLFNTLKPGGRLVMVEPLADKEMKNFNEILDPIQVNKRMESFGFITEKPIIDNNMKIYTLVLTKPSK